LAISLARKYSEVTLWARTAEEAERLDSERENSRFLPSMRFPSSLRVSCSLAEALRDCSLLLLVVPSQTMRSNLRQIREYLNPQAVIVSATKGLELGTGKRMSEVIREELASTFGPRVCVLSGPNLAREIAQGMPASAVVAAQDDEVARQVQDTLNSPTFRVYTSSDVIGVEYCGALKNIIALGAGISDGLGFGDNSKAAFMTRGLAEITRIGVAAGANILTFSGLAGLGDLVATCSSRLSRNHHVGEELAKGKRLAEIQQSMASVAEGVWTTQAALQLAHHYGVEMPITEMAYQVLFNDKDPRRAVVELMSREPKHELHGFEEQMRSLLR
jgi:glycerol-3-phosphate dehydrogenase (NAD(P)+)